MNKRFIILMSFVVCFICGCSLNRNDGANQSNIDKIGEPNIVEIEYSDIDWESIEFPVELDEIKTLSKNNKIKTKQDAITLGYNIIAECHENRKFPEYTLCSIVHSSKDNIWQFEYSLDQSDVSVYELIDCGALFVAIDGNKGTLIKAWVTE